MRLLFVTPRYGEVAGGAERAIRGFATRCCDGWDVEVATTCAVDHHLWHNELPEGTEQDGAVLVHRFSVTQRPDGLRFAGRSYLSQVASLADSVWSAPMQRFLAAEAPRFDAIVPAPYLLGTTFWSAAAHPARSLLVPCLHDEPDAHTAPMRALLARVRGCLFLSRAEEALARSLAPIRAGARGRRRRRRAVAARGRRRGCGARRPRARAAVRDLRRAGSRRGSASTRWSS